MADHTVTLRLTADAKGVVTGVATASGTIGKLGRDAEKSGEQASRGLTRACGRAPGTPSMRRSRGRHCGRPTACRTTGRRPRH